jgi:hypothetical protein
VYKTRSFYPVRCVGFSISASQHTDRIHARALSRRRSYTPSTPTARHHFDHLDHTHSLTLNTNIHTPSTHTSTQTNGHSKNRQTQKMQSHFLSLFLLCIFAALSLAAPLARRSGAGQATYYAPGLGACGQYNTASDLIGAVAVGLGKGVCGSKVQITRPTTGQTVEITITDLCQGCVRT